MSWYAGCPLDVILLDQPCPGSGQQFALISFVSPNGTYQHAEQMLLKIRGVFPSVDTARERAKVLSAIDDKFDLYIVDLYKWVREPRRSCSRPIGECNICRYVL